MISLPYFATILAVSSYAWYYYRCFATNLRTAKASGIPYIVVPIYPFHRFWLITQRIWLPLLQRLPKSLTSPWLDFLVVEWSWHTKYEPFKNIGSDVFLIVSPGMNILHIADAEATTQICTRRNDFPKPIDMYGALDIYGKNVVTTEGAIWRHHRRLTSPPFAEKNNQVVWKESLHQGQAMLESWLGSERTRSKAVHTVAEDCMRLSLHVISRAGFGVQLLWPHEEAKGQKPADGEVVFSKEHTMSYKDALETLLNNILWILLFPRWLLARSPLKAHKRAYNAYVEWGRYMTELYESKKAGVLAGEVTEGLDLMGAMVGMSKDKDAANGDAEKGHAPATQALKDDEILGNAFVFILAGHETAANSIHFSLLYLALNPSSQRHVQKDIDAIFGDRPVDQWDYEHDINKLFGSMVGAVMNEELRLLAPVPNIPKCTQAQPQPLTLHGRKYVVPAHCNISLSTVATHRNPKYWPTAPQTGKRYPPGKTTLDEFRPERWLRHSSATAGVDTPDHATDSEGEDIGGSKGHDTSASLFRPVKGAYIPFSEGYRSCLGRRFAQVEVLAVLAVILREYSVELAVDEFASDEEVDAMPQGGPERKAVWEKAADKAGSLLSDGMYQIITLQMREGHVPLQMVKRGKERFAFA